MGKWSKYSDSFYIGWSDPSFQEYQREVVILSSSWKKIRKLSMPHVCGGWVSA
jgi:hypothetical protein